mgnify:CR=1 FL=1
MKRAARQIESHKQHGAASRVKLHRQLEAAVSARVRARQLKEEARNTPPGTERSPASGLGLHPDPSEADRIIMQGWRWQLDTFFFLGFMASTGNLEFPSELHYVLHSSSMCWLLRAFSRTIFVWMYVVSRRMLKKALLWSLLDRKDTRKLQRMVYRGLRRTMFYSKGPAGGLFDIPAAVHIHDMMVWGGVGVAEGVKGGSIYD